jgi:hypothetical protein
MGLLRQTRDGGPGPAGGDDDAAGRKADTAATTAGLPAAQRARIDAELAARGIGDALERRMFLAALDYQVASFANRMPHLADSGTALAEEACTAAAAGLDGTTGDEAQRVCRAFVTELARAYDACFETPPTADSNGPFGRILRTLRESTGLTLHCDRRLIDQAIGTVTPGTP